ncbi:MmcQ/YjbR family DNA-binding protein [Streptomyces klenkii]|uniref:MmcQ/YjbR family DNA-binding protein n=1 Tax=Streptomyces klenkii TaxID=1420899 RepID=UPI003414021D
MLLKPLPGVVEVAGWGMNSFRVRRTTFLVIDALGHRLHVRVGLKDWLCLVKHGQTMARPIRVCRRPGWVSLVLPEADHSLVHDMVTESWKRASGR